MSYTLPRFVSWLFSTQCLAFAMTPCDWIPRMTGCTSWWPSMGSSPERYSKLRPLRGTRARHKPGPSCTFEPLARNSLPMPTPHSSMAATSQEAAMVRPEGQAVEVPGCLLSRNPWGPSFIVRGGMRSRALGATLPTYAQRAVLHCAAGPVGGPCRKSSFSSRVKFAARSLARVDGARLGDDHGPGTRAPMESATLSEAAIRVGQPDRLVFRECVELSHPVE